MFLVDPFSLSVRHGGDFFLLFPDPVTAKNKLVAPSRFTLFTPFSKFLYVCDLLTSTAPFMFYSNNIVLGKKQ